MSGKRSRAQRDDNEPRPGDGKLWISSEWTFDGPYVVVMHVEDRTWPLTPTEVFAYAQYVMGTASRADHDSAVIRQFIKTGLGAEEAVHMIFNLRADRPPLDPGNQPLRFEPGVSSDGKFRGFIAIHLDDGRQVGQWSPLQAQEHATAALGIIATAELDTALYQTLKGTVELPENTARAVVYDLQNHRTMK